jgi:hypothetical protein
VVYTAEDSFAVWDTTKEKPFRVGYSGKKDFFLRYNRNDDHDIRYKQCPSCYRKKGGTNYVGW